MVNLPAASDARGVAIRGPIRWLAGGPRGTGARQDTRLRSVGSLPSCGGSSHDQDEFSRDDL